ncbi:MAG TPA: hypothetical protein VFD60_01810 [Nitrososphaeraceae archaeon]|jgi:hypothetical protein|nr:hypothetical protein [Nitrososphaeraceae archaeon]
MTEVTPKLNITYVKESIRLLEKQPDIYGDKNKKIWSAKQTLIESLEE